MTTYGTLQWSGQTWAANAAQGTRLSQLAQAQEALLNGGFIDSGASKVLAGPRLPPTDPMRDGNATTRDSITPSLTINIANTLVPNRAVLYPPGTPQPPRAGNTVLSTVNGHL